MGIKPRTIPSTKGSITSVLLGLAIFHPYFILAGVARER
jgi:hypothetical protein